MRVIFLGTPEFAVPSLEAVADAFDVVAVVTQPERPAGRGRELTPPAVRAAAARRGLPAIQPETMRDPAVVARLAALRPDVLVVVAYGEILRRDVRALAPAGCVNVHPSLLPLHRGAAPVAAALLAGDAETGVSLIRLERALDAGPIIAQERAPILPADTAATLSGRLARHGADLLARTLPDWVAGHIEPIPQDEARATCIRQLRRGDGRVDWRLDTAEIVRRWRAFEPWPGTFTTWSGRTLRLADLSEAPADGEPGRVLDVADGAVLIASGHGAVAVRTLQLEGKRPLPASEFARGQPHLLGAQLGS